MGDVIGAFSEDYASRLTGVTRSKLRYWDSLGFMRASYASGGAGSPYRLVYSFRDLVGLRVLHELQTEHRVSTQELRRVSEKLAGDQDNRWTARKLWVHERKVVWADPRARRQMQEISTGQYVFECIPLSVVASGVRDRITELNRRNPAEIGQVERARFVAHNQPVLAGTRIPVRAVQSFAAAGYSVADILKEYPSLSRADVRAALAYEGDSAAA